MKLPLAERWRAAITNEMNKLQMNRVYHLVSQHKVPAGLKSIGSRWVHKVKSDNTTKARVVGQG
ncbi:unnamed protein product [Sphacelaria rigidula]